MENTGGAKFTLANKDIHKIDLALYDEDFNYINFNNINWSILLCLYITYEMPFFTINDTINNKTSDNKPIKNSSLNELDFLNS